LLHRLSKHTMRPPRLRENWKFKHILQHLERGTLPKSVFLEQLTAMQLNESPCSSTPILNCIFLVFRIGQLWKMNLCKAYDWIGVTVVKSPSLLYRQGGTSILS